MYYKYILSYDRYLFTLLLYMYYVQLSSRNFSHLSFFPSKILLFSQFIHKKRIRKMITCIISLILLNLLFLSFLILRYIIQGLNILPLLTSRNVDAHHQQFQRLLYFQQFQLLVLSQVLPPQ